MKVPDTKEDAGLCICPNCPTYNECMEKGGQMLYCARERSDCEVIRQGCICGQCPIASQYLLSERFFCNG